MALSLLAGAGEPPATSVEMKGVLFFRTLPIKI
jgi:hypothetical protein